MGLWGQKDSIKDAAEGSDHIKDAAEGSDQGFESRSSYIPALPWDATT